MQIRYRVHSAVVEKTTVAATLQGGQEVSAQVDGLTIELVEIDGSDTLTRRFVPDDMAAALALFPVDGEVVATLTAAE